MATLPQTFRNGPRLIFVVRRLNPEETMVRDSTTRTEVSRGQNPGLKTPPFLAVNGYKNPNVGELRQTWRVIVGCSVELGRCRARYFLGEA